MIYVLEGLLLVHLDEEATKLVSAEAQFSVGEEDASASVLAIDLYDVDADQCWSASIKDMPGSALAIYQMLERHIGDGSLYERERVFFDSSHHLVHLSYWLNGLYTTLSLPIHCNQDDPIYF